MKNIKITAEFDAEITDGTEAEIVDEVESAMREVIKAKDIVVEWKGVVIEIGEDASE